MCVDVLVNWCLYGIKLSLRGKYFFLWCRVLRLLSHSITSNGNQRRGNKFQTLFQTNKLVKGNPTQHKGKDKGVYKMLKIWRKIGQTSVVNILRTFPLSTQWKWWILPISTFCTGASPWNHYSSLWHICTWCQMDTVKDMLYFLFNFMPNIIMLEIMIFLFRSISVF